MIVTESAGISYVYQVGFAAMISISVARTAVDKCLGRFFIGATVLFFSSLLGSVAAQGLGKSIDALNENALLLPVDRAREIDSVIVRLGDRVFDIRHYSDGRIAVHKSLTLESLIDKFAKSESMPDPQVYEAVYRNLGSQESDQKNPWFPSWHVSVYPTVSVLKFPSVFSIIRIRKYWHRFERLLYRDRGPLAVLGAVVGPGAIPSSAMNSRAAIITSERELRALRPSAHVENPNQTTVAIGLSRIGMRLFESQTFLWPPSSDGLLSATIIPAGRERTIVIPLPLQMMGGPPILARSVSLRFGRYGIELSHSFFQIPIFALEPDATIGRIDGDVCSILFETLSEVRNRGGADFSVLLGALKEKIDACDELVEIMAITPRQDPVELPIDQSIPGN